MILSKVMVMKRIITLLVFLISGLTFAQTTVNLEDQCNCEVLSGTDVTAPGLPTPAGADIGDIYVNTDTGTIYFWDGDSWELTSSDDQQLQNFTFDNVSGELSLTLENGGTATVILPVETITTLTGTAALGNAIGVYENENGDLVTINETITTISDAGDGNITLTNESGATVTVAKSDITDLGGGLYRFTNGDGTDVDINTNGIAITDVVAGNLIATVTQADGTFTEIDETITTLSTADSVNYTYTSENGTPTSFDGTDDQEATEVNLTTPLDVDGDSVDETTVEEAIIDLAANASDNQNLTGATLSGTNQLQIDIERGSSTSVDLSSLVETVIAGTGAISVADDGNGNYTVTSTDPDEDETNELTLIDSGAPVVIPSNSGVTYVDDVAGQLYVFDGTTWQQVGGSAAPDADPDPNNELQTLTSTDGSVTLTPSGNDYDLSVAVVDGTETKVESGNANVTVTGDGSTATPYQISSVDLDEQNATEVPLDAPFDVDGDTVNETTVQEALEDLAANASDNQQVSSAVGTPNETVAIDLERGGSTTINIQDADADATNEIQDATEVALNTPFDVDGDTVNETTVQEALEDLAANASDNQQVSSAVGTPNETVDIDLERGGSTTINIQDADADATNEIQDATEVALNTPFDVDGDTVNETTVQEALEDLAANASDDQTLSTDGNPGNISISEGNAISLNVDDADANASNEIQTLTSTDGSVTLTPSGNDYDLSVAVVDGTETKVESGNANVTVTGDGSIASPYQISSVDLDEQNATEVLLDAPFDVDGDTVNETTVQEALEDLAANASDNQQISSTVTTPNELVNVALERGSNFDIDIRDADSDVTNELTLLGNGSPTVTPSNSGVTYVDEVAGQLYVYDGTTWNAVGGNASPDLDGNPNNEIQTVASADGSVDVVRTGDDFDLSITIPANNDNDATNEFQDLSLTGDNLTLSDDPTATAIDLSPYANNDTNEIQTVASADGSVDVVRTGDDFDLSITIPANNDNDATNEFQDLSLTGDNLTLSDDPTATAIDLGPYANNDTNEIQTVASADGSVDVVRTGDDFDLSITIPANNDNDATNEIQTVASSDGSVDVVRTGDDFDLSITIPANNDNDATNEIQDLGIAGDQLSITGGNTVTIPTADGSETIVNGAGINTVTGSGTTASPYVVTGTEVDGDITNELTFVNAGTPAATGTTGINSGETYVDTLTGQLYVYDGSTWQQVGGNASPDADPDPNNEIQTVASADGSVDVVRTGDDFDLSITIPTNNDNDATNEFQDLSLTGDNLTLSDDPTATAIDLSPYANNDTNEIQTVASSDGSVDVVRTGDDFDLSITIPANNDNDATNEIQTVVSSDGSVDVVRTGDDFDLSITIPANNDNDATNEFQDLSLTGDNLTLSDDPTATAIDLSPYANNDTNEIQTVASADGSVDVVRTGDDFDLSITIPANNDNDATNEFQDLSLTGDNLTLSDDPTATAIDLSPYANNDTNEIQTVASADGSVDVVRTGDDFDLSITIPANNDNDATNEIQTVASADGSVDVVRTGDDFDLSITIPTNNDNDANNEIQDLGIAGDQLSITGGNTITLPSADGSETVVNGAGINAVTGSGTTASPYVVTGTEVDGDITNELTFVDAGTPAATGTTGTNSGETYVDTLTGQLYVYDGSTWQQVGGNASPDADPDPNNEIQTVASADGSVDVVRTGDDFDLSITIPANNDNDATNEIQDLGIVGDQLSITGGNTVTIPTADGSETIVNGAGINTVTGSGTTASPYVVTGTEVDGDITNEIQTVASADGSVDVVRTGDDFDLSITIPTNNDNDATNEIQDLGIAGDQLSITGGNTITLPSADGSETVVNGAGINTVTGSGTTASPYVVTGTEVDGDITNELTFVDAGTPAATGTTGTNSGETYVDTLTGQLYVYDGSTWQQVGGNASPDADPDPNNEIQTITSTDGSVTLTQTGDDYNLSVAAADGTETKVESGNANITVTGDGSTTSPYQISSVDNVDDADADATNEIQDLGIVGDQLSITGGNTVTIPTADGTETKVESGNANVTVTGDGSTGSPYQISSVDNVDDADADATNEIQDLGIAGNQLSITGGNTVTIPTADGSETIVNGAGINSVTGSGTTASPYVVTGTEVDGDITNEIQTVASSDGSVDVVRTGDDFDLSITIPTNNDNDATNEFQDLSLTGDNLTLSDDPTATAIDLSPYANNDTNEIQTVASADGSVDVVRTGDDFDLSITIPTNNDNDATNEIQDLGIAGDQLSITGGNTVTIPTADGSETIVNGAGINAVTGSGTTASPYVVTGTEVDGDIRNEIQTVASADGSVDVVRTGDDFDLSITIPANNDNDATNEIQDLGIVGDQLSITGGNTVTIPTADGTETKVESGNANVTVTGDGSTGSPYQISSVDNIDDADADATNEIQDLGIAGDQLSITGGNTVTIPTADGSETIVNGAGINSVTGSGTTASPYVVTGTEVDGDITNEIQTLTSTDGSVTLTPSGDDYDLSVAAADGSETVVNGAGINAVTGSGTTASPYVVTGTEVDGDITNEIQTVASSDGSVDVVRTGDDFDLSITIPANNDNDATNEIQTVASADGSVDVVRTGDDFDLSITIPANNDNDATNEIQTVASSDGSVDVVRTGDDFDLSITIPTNNDNDATNEIQDLGIAGDQLSITGGNTVTIPTADGSETIVNGAGINAVTGSGTTASPYVVTGTEVDGDITNEIQTVASADGSVDVVRTGDDFDLSITIPANNDNDATNEFQDLSLTGDNLTLSDDPTATAIDLSPYANNDTNEIQTVASADGSVDVVRTGDDFDLSITIPANNDNDATNEIQDLGIAGDQLSITGGNTVTIPTADGSETIVNGAGINSVTGSGTTASPYVVTGTEVDGDITNEIQTLTSTDGSVTLTETNDDYNLSVNFPASSDNQNIESLAVNTTSNVLTVGIEDGTSQTVDLSHLDNTGTDNQNIESLAINTSSNVLTVGIEDGSSQTVNLSHLDNSGTDNQSIRNLTFSGNTLTVGIENGSSDTVSLAALADNQSIQGSGLSGNTLTIGIEDGSSETVNLSSLANTDNQQISLSGNIITLDNGTGANTTVDLTDFRDDQNLTSAVVVPNQSVEVQINDGTNTTIDIRDADSDATNELQDLELAGSTLTLTNPATSGNSVDLSGLADHDWYEVGGTSAPDAITDNIFTEGNVGIGTTTITNNRALDVEGNVEINDYLYMNGKNTLRATDDNYLRINWSNDYVLGTFFNGNVRMYDGLVVNERGANSDMRVEGDTETFLLFTDASSDEVGIGTSSPDARLDVEGGTVRFSDYGSNAITGTATSLLGVEADGDLVEVNSLKASKIFYPPSIEVDASTNGTGRTIDLHAQYVAQYGSPMVASASAPAAIPTYANTELYYYVTFYDTAVFANVNVNAAGVMTYDVIGQPASYNSLINVVFVVK
nr:hypothetical protein [Zobellia laminariae]